MKKGTGLIIVPQERQEKESIIKRGTGMLILMAYFYLGTLGCMLGLFSIIPFLYDAKILWLGTWMIGLYFVLICCTRKLAPLAIVITAGLYSGILFKNWDFLAEGAAAIIETGRRTFQFYWGGQQGILMGVAGFEQQVTFCMLAIVFLWSGLLFAGLFLRGGAFFAMLEVGIVFAVGLIIGKLPDFLPVCIMILGVAGAYSTEGIENISGQKQGSLLLSITIILLFLIGSFCLAPVMQPIFANKMELRKTLQNSELALKLQKQVKDLTNGSKNMGMDDGKLNSRKFMDPTDERMLKLKTEILPQELSYLRCYIGTDYTGNAWRPVQDRQNEEINWQYFQKLYDISQQSGFSEPFEMKIEVIKPEGEYTYQPYFSQKKEGENDDLDYIYYSSQDIEQWYEAGLFGYQGDEEYLKYVYGHYLSYPEDSLQKLKEVCDANPQNTIKDTIGFIRNYLQGNAAYNLEVDDMPAGKEFTEYFLFERKEGYCVHFATAAALMLRMYGIPSRYVTGYVAGVDSFQYDVDQYVSYVTGKQAHAWTEIYLDGIGWMPVEATPGYLDTGMISPSETENGINNPRNTESEPQTQMQSDTDIEERVTQETEFVMETEWVAVEKSKIPLWLAILLCILLAAAGLLAGGRIWIQKKRKDAGVKELFWDIGKMLSYAGFTEELEEETVYIQQAMEALPWLPKRNFVKLVQLAMRANYDRGFRTKKETRFTHDMYHLIYKHVRESLKGIRKIIFIFLYESPQ